MSHLQLHGARLLQVRLWLWPLVSMPGHQLRRVPELHAGQTGGQGQGTCGSQEDSRRDDQPRTLLNDSDTCYCCMARVAHTSDLEWGAWYQLPVVTCVGCQVCTLIKQKALEGAQLRCDICGRFYSGDPMFGSICDKCLSKM